MPITSFRVFDLIVNPARGSRQDGRWPVAPSRGWRPPSEERYDHRVRARMPASAAQYLRPRNALGRRGGRPEPAFAG
ncbi:hypothetical protein Pla175_16520 [Pirellulimonas nuda]|uniref:Uncharacterized protein n=1 Tax=Pirellulimonas nuda TaxID=2528009 RepID=A0A518DA11_9BACT|nr:hypothetical protein [Pirellulimonas nuda]QDU88278.1 hypothetical protein Pla175_16520 [Pirellulimonas nuda]